MTCHFAVAAFFHVVFDGVGCRHRVRTAVAGNDDGCGRTAELHAFRDVPSPHKSINKSGCISVASPESFDHLRGKRRPCIRLAVFRVGDRAVLTVFNHDNLGVVVKPFVCRRLIVVRPDQLQIAPSCRILPACQR